jgi:hypothetical protein
VSDPADPDAGPWWTICEADFLRALRRVAAGESPDLVYADLYANSEHGYSPPPPPPPPGASE